MEEEFRPGLIPARAAAALGRLLGLLNLWVVCGILYYLVVTPYGLLLRAFGFRPLELKPDAALKTYWEEKPPRDPAESSKRIF